MAIIYLRACDDSQEFEVDITPTQLEALRRVATASQVEGGGCTPSMAVYRDKAERVQADENDRLEGMRLLRVKAAEESGGLPT